MSTEIRKKYELKVRAEQQRETRDRIARAASELHEEKGVAQTTVAEIARLAGVSRLTVYNHFPDLDALLPACSAHYESVHPAPDFGPALAVDDLGARLERVLESLYAWYRETEALFSKILSDRASVPELDRFLTGQIDRMQDELAASVSRSIHGARRHVAERRALVRLAVDFWTWRRLSLEGLSDASAARVMAESVTRP